ncbi:MAG: hypothetical protein IJS08_10855 [Victivallales bacterium]|nr:hypothetical protein [Victivallales bacterium]
MRAHCIWMSYAVIALLSCLLANGMEDELLPSGQGGNMLLNGSLFLEAGDFPANWSSKKHKPDYFPEGFPQGGGSLRFHEKGKLHTIRQDWTFSIVEGEKYRLSYWMRSQDFKARQAKVLSFNNGWTSSAESSIPAGSSDWRQVELVFDGFPSKGGVGSVGILVDGIEQGFVEIANICLEPATRKAQEASVAYLKEIPPQKLIPLAPRLNEIQNQLTLRWFGEADVKQIAWFLSGKAMGMAAPDANGVVALDFSQVKPGEYTLELKAGDFTLTRQVRRMAEIKTQGIRRNNFNTLIFSANCKEGEAFEFGLEGSSWISLKTAPGMTIELAGMKHGISGSMPVHLAAGMHQGKVVKGAGQIEVSVIAETLYYQLAGGPYLNGIPKHTYAMVKKQQLDCVTTFSNGGPTSSQDWDDFRKCHSNYLLEHASVGDVTGDTLRAFRGLAKDTPYFDGIIADEFSGGNNRQLAKFLKHREALSNPYGKAVYAWVTGTPGNSPILAGFLSCFLNDLRGKVIYESYVPNNYTDEAEARNVMQRKFNHIVQKFKKLYPGCEKVLGFALCHSNIPLSFTIDNEPEANFKYLLDMQMNLLAKHPDFQNLSLIGTWGGNYADEEMTRWFSALLRHYVIEGKTDMLSAPLGWSLAPKHIQNASFRKGLEHWEASGNVSLGTQDSMADILRQFNIIPGKADAYAVIAPGASLSQKIANLAPGKLYVLKYVTSDATNVKGGRPKQTALAATLEDADIVANLIKYRKPIMQDRNTRMGNENYDAVLFRAKKDTARVTLSASATAARPSGLHFVSIMPYYEDKIE